MCDKLTYKAFGLNIESEFELPELAKLDVKPDVTIVYGETPQHLQNPAIQTPWYEIKAGEFLLTVDHIAKYYVENGRRIVIKPLTGSDDDDIRTFLFNGVFAALLQQRGFLALHGSAAVINGKGVALLGGCSCGKTALALALYDRGFTLLTDEICAIRLMNGSMVIHPGIPWLHAWQDTLETAGKNTGGLRRVRRGLHKYSFPVQNRFAAEPVELSHIIMLDYHNRKEVITETVRGGNKLEALLRQAFFTETATNKMEHFKTCAAASATRMINLSYCTIPGMADQVAELIVKEVGI